MSQAYGGGPLSKERGDFLVSQGVTILNLYGSYVPFDSQYKRYIDGPAWAALNVAPSA